jgi:HEAT repeat protein
MHIFSGTLINGSKKTAIKTYFYNGKVPVWSMDEILEPCFNIPISIIIKDVASKIDRAAFNLKASDQKVKSLSAAIDAQIANKDYSEFWKVLELGYTNNPEAINPLKKYAQTGDELFDSCALSSIGTLGAIKEAEFMKARYKAGKYNDRYMAAKALGDLATPDAMQMLVEMKKDSLYEKEAGLKYCIDLYLQ